MEPSAGSLSSPSSSSSSPPAPESIKRRSGGRRSRNGCWTCRLKKVKCDETRPHCLRCSRLRLLCKYDKAVVDTVSTKAKDSPCQTLSRQLPQFTNSASSLDLTPADHEAIRYFRTTFARLHHTKNPDYSVYSIIFAVAENQPLVMRMLLAVGGREMESRRPAAQKCLTANTRKAESWASLHHYAAALKSLADTLSQGDNGEELLDLDASFTLLYLMIQYETRYGDPECLGLQNHLKGAAAILSRRCRNIRDQLSVLTMTDPPALASQIPPGEPQLSLYTARVLIWISISDAAAATYGVGGIFNDTLHQLLGCSESTMSSLHSVADGVEVVHTYSNPLFRVMWGPTYPQEELLDDIENRSVFELMLGCFQVRHLLAKVAQASDSAERQYRLDITAATMQAMTTRYSEVLQVAGGLYPSTGSSHRLVRNLRIAAPHYHAVVLLFERFSRELTGSKAPIDPKTHCSSIIGLAKQAFRHGGDEAVISVAWPLLVAALEPEGQNHHEWINRRFRDMVRFGPRFGHVYEFLERYMASDSNNESSPWLDPGTWFRSNCGKLFVL